jgi:hypothetical protein
MRAPRDQRKSSDNQFEPAELNALRCQRPMFWERNDLVQQVKILAPIVCESSIRGMCCTDQLNPPRKVAVLGLSKFVTVGAAAVASASGAAKARQYSAHRATRLCMR